MNKKILIAIGVMTALSVVLFIALFIGKRETDTDVIRIGILKHESSLPIYVADELKIFEKYNVSVRLVELPPGDHMPALLSDRVDLISATSFPVLFGVLENNPELLYAIMPGAEIVEGETVYGIITKADFKGDDIYSLKNKKILAINPYTKVSLLNILKNINFSDSEIKDVNIANKDAALAAVLDNSADACIMDQPPLAIAINSQKFKLLEPNPRAKYISNPYWSGSGAIKKETWDKNSQLYLNFLKAIDEAALYARNNSVEAHKILAKRLDIDENIALEMGGYYFPTIQEYVDKAELKNTISALINAGLLKNDIDLLHIFPDNLYSK